MVAEIPYPKISFRSQQYKLFLEELESEYVQKPSFYSTLSKNGMESYYNNRNLVENGSNLANIAESALEIAVEGITNAGGARPIIEASGQFFGEFFQGIGEFIAASFHIIIHIIEPIVKIVLQIVVGILQGLK